MASMQSAMDLFLSSAMYAVHTSLPAKVEKYDAKKHTATVKPAVNMLMDNGVQIEIPSLMEVPVVFPASKFFDLEFPLDEGDGVLLLFQESDISTWKNGDFPAIPAVASRFNLDSAVAIPGLVPSPSKGKARISIDKNGVITWTAKKIVYDAQVVFKKDVLAREDIYVGPAPTGPGVSVKNHIHPTAVGPTSAPTPTPITPEV